MTPKIVVIGAGVSGLTTALELKKSNSEYDVSVVAQHLPGDYDVNYVSPYAGANWYSFATPEDKILQEFDKPSYKVFMELAQNEPRSGIWHKMSYAYFTEDYMKEINYDTGKGIPWFKDFVEEFKILEKKELPEGILFGFLFKGVVISVPIYLNFLLSKALENGIAIKRVKAIENVEDARNLHSSGNKADFVINCSGLLAFKLKGYKDPNRSYGIRGQTLHVRNNASKQIEVQSFGPDFEDEMLYIMPRKEGGSIIGGCFIENYKNTEEDKELTQRLVNRAKKYAPEMFDPGFKNNPTEIDIIRVNVGLRPFRDGGVRVESDSDNGWLIHNYGAGGGGYQGSHGFSSTVVSLVKQALDKKMASKL